MAYEKQNFTDGMVLLSKHLNHIEDGIVANEEKPFKTINGESIVGEGDITIEGGGASSWNDLTDKPFGEEQLIEWTFDEDVVFSQDYGDGYIESDGEYTLIGGLIVGNEYKVTYDGEEYTCVCYDSDGLSLGDESIWGGEPTGDYPFAAYAYDYDGQWYIGFATPTTGEPHISIAGVWKTITKLSSEVLPQASDGGAGIISRWAVQDIICPDFSYYENVTTPNMFQQNTGIFRRVFMPDYRLLLQFTPASHNPSTKIMFFYALGLDDGYTYRVQMNYTSFDEPFTSYELINVNNSRVS